MRGFTLVEVMVAVAVAALLLTGVAGASQASLQAARRQKEIGRREVSLERALEILQADWRGRVKLKKLDPVPGLQGFRLETSSDSLGKGATRATLVVDYLASERGLVRRESGSELVLLTGPLKLEFWDRHAWRLEPAGPVLALRVMLTSKPDAFIIE